MRRADGFLLMGVVGISLAAWLCLRMAAPAARSVQVTVRGEAVFSAPIDQPGEYVLDDTRGYNRVIIENHAAYMAEADCPDQLCVKQGAIARAGEPIVCLPNRVVVTVMGGEEQRVDTVSQ